MTDEPKAAIGVEASSALLNDRALAAWEFVSVVSSIVIAEWALAATAGLNKAFAAVPAVLALALMIFSHRTRHETLRDLGFRTDNFVRALKLLILPVLVFAAVALIVGWRLGGHINFSRWRPDRYLVVQLLIGVVWALAQQYVLQGFLNRRAVALFGRGWMSILLIGVVFGALHLPNIWLAVITLIGGAIWAAVYQREPNLFALAVSHAVMTWFVISTLPPSLLQHLRVGLRYFG